MTLSESKRVYKCKICGKSFTAFERPNGSLVIFPENYPWPVHGEYELTSHLRASHKDGYYFTQLFYPDISEQIQQCYAIS